MAEIKSPYRLTIRKDKCKGCQLCIFSCPTKNLILSADLNKRGVKYAKVNKHTKCSGCGFCFLVCPDCCIEIYTEDRGQKSDDR